MNDVMKLLLTLVIGYLLGSISTGVILSRVFGHKDIRNQGSGNSGTTNMLRVMGKKFAFADVRRRPAQGHHRRADRQSAARHAGRRNCRRVWCNSGT